MPTNPFDQVLIGFQQAYAGFGGGLFCLVGLTYDEVCAEPEIYDSAYCLGHVPLAEDDSGRGDQMVCEKGLKSVREGLGGGGGRGYYIFGLSRGEYARPHQAFRILAEQAGASLPQEARQRILVKAADPAAWWLAFMWWQNPPSEEDLAPPDGVNTLCRLIWSEPFLESIEAIEKGGLCTSDTNASPHASHEQVHHKPWEPPESHARVSTICGDPDTGQGAPEYQKDGKSPPRTTVQQWADRDQPEVIHDPATYENCYPKSWAWGCVEKWSPREPR